MKKDIVDKILDQWSGERPDLDTTSLGVVIRMMTLYRSFLRQATRALEPLELELWEYDVLSALRRQGKPYMLPATRLARETDLSSGAMTNRIDRLETRGLVRRRPDPKDRRGVNVSLTAKGRKLIDKGIQHRLDSARESLQALSAAQQRQLAQLLRIAVLTAPDED
ncbi:MAG: MarR family transcriptional regulator [Gammaproteobacteria bacterium]|jgi:DNA-binding MarR family transcriptional regulator|nr:MarR family transcriptional regulator [Gammaproteobacteria bacterium]